MRKAGDESLLLRPVSCRTVKMMLSRQLPINLTRRKIVKLAAMCAAGAAVPRSSAMGTAMRVFDVAKFGAVGDGMALDSPAIQRAIDAAAAYGGKSQVLLRGRKKYLVGTLELKGRIDFHLADDAELLASLRAEDYLGGLAGSGSADSMASAV